MRSTRNFGMGCEPARRGFQPFGSIWKAKGGLEFAYHNDECAYPPSEAAAEAVAYLRHLASYAAPEPTSPGYEPTSPGYPPTSPTHSQGTL